MRNLIVLGMISIFVTGCATSRIEGWKRLIGGKAASKKELRSEMKKAKRHWNKRHEKSELEKSLKAFEAVANSSDSPYEAMKYLARGYYLLADGHTEDMEEKKRLWEVGIAWGEKAMATNSEFKKRVIDNGEKIEDVLKYLTKSEIEAIYWTATNLGKWGKNSGIVTVLKYKTRIKNMINRVGELDKNFFYGAFNRYWGAYYAVAPGFAGGDMDKSWNNFQSAIKIEKNYLGNYVLVADYWAKKKGDQKLFKSELRKVLAGNVNAIPAIRSENIIEQRKAKKLLSMMDELF
jgi:hypothetical protein